MRNSLKTSSSKRFVIALIASFFVPTAFANFSVPPGFSLSFPDGSSLDVACGLLDVQGELLLVDSAGVTAANVIDIGSAGVLSAGSGTLYAGEGWNNDGSFVPGNSTLIIDDSCGESAPFVFTGNTVFNNLTIISTSGRTVEIPAGGALQVNGILTLQGNGPQPLRLVSPGPGLASIRLGPNAQVFTDNVSLAADVSIGERVIEAIPSLGVVGLSLLVFLLAFLGRINLAANNPIRNRNR